MAMLFAQMRAVRPIPVCEGMDTNPSACVHAHNAMIALPWSVLRGGACRDQRIEVRNRLLQSPFKGAERLGDLVGGYTPASTDGDPAVFPTRAHPETCRYSQDRMAFIVFSLVGR